MEEQFVRLRPEEVVRLVGSWFAHNAKYGVSLRVLRGIAKGAFRHVRVCDNFGDLEYLQRYINDFLTTREKALREGRPDISFRVFDDYES